MRIECPHCHAVFEVPEAMVERATRLRCANCGDSWTLESVPRSAGEEAAENPVFAAPEVQPEEAVGNGPSSPEMEQPVEGSPSPVSQATKTMSLRDTGRRHGLLHSHSAEKGAVSSGSGPLGTLTAWMAAWGVSLALVGGGSLAFWHWKGPVLVQLFAGIGHTVSP
ncbi:zinc-ribbon domain-containing protein [Gluconobacter morbifer]|uniref:Zinc finger/thioredoxin putative domain-containing protein n=1 Tax=Gluconobacter morbifer G707 TaxID=1088869 RepID=G6XKT6_9PROT|nr:zinc-ribbon domain-containing protein [Gluconobacter morbifer]EHH67649.1 hypothetical protein GMO_21020 [Gluconobacter morbifer G707]